MQCSHCKFTMLNLVIISVILSFLPYCCRTRSSYTLSVSELIKHHGYPSETHFVTTKDGYILAVDRIPSRPSTDKIVLLQHGLVSSSADWIVLGPGKSLGFLLADKGYDVWIANSRGNTFSKNHTKLSTKSKKFWNFSWHEMGIYDLPAIIDYILKQTNQEKLYYVGHSQGNTIFYVLTSEFPEYNSKFHVQVSLAPVAFIDHPKNFLSIFGWLFRPLLIKIQNLFGPIEVLQHLNIVNDVVAPICRPPIFSNICKMVFYTIVGPKESNANMTSEIISYFPAGTSSKTFIHYFQWIKTGYFRHYDYGSLKNFKKYGSSSPPDYVLEKITVPVYGIWSSNDRFADKLDVRKLFKKLGNSQELFKVNDNNFNHLDFLYAKNNQKLVYDHVLEILSQYY